MLIWRPVTCLLREREAGGKVVIWYCSEDRLTFKVKMQLREGKAHTTVQKWHLDATHTTSLCIFGDESVYFSSPKQAYATVNCNLFYLMCHSLNYHLSFYSVPLLWNEQNKTFQSIFFFPNSSKLHVEFAGLATGSPLPPLFF